MPKNHKSDSFLPAGAWDVDHGGPAPLPQWNFMIAGDWGSIMLRINKAHALWYPYPRGGAPDWDDIERWLMDSERRVNTAFSGSLTGLAKDAFEHLQANWPTA